MDITAFWLNKKRQSAGNGKFYYYYPYTPCDKDSTAVIYHDGKNYVRIAVSEEEWQYLTDADNDEHNNDRRYYNKKWRENVPDVVDEKGEQADFWSECAEDRNTSYIAEDICERLDYKALLRRWDKRDRKIYRLDSYGYSQKEIARILKTTQSTVSRRLEKLYLYVEAERLNDGSRSINEIAFELAWADYSRMHYIKGGYDMTAVVFTLLVGEQFLTTLYQWFCSPGELMRYCVRYLMVGGTESKEELFTAISKYGQEFFYERQFDKQPEDMQMLCLRALRELERRFLTMPEPSGNVFHGMEAAIKKAAHRRHLEYDFYFEEILLRRYRLRRISFLLEYCRRICTDTKDEAVKSAMKKEIVLLLRERKPLSDELKTVITQCRIEREKLKTIPPKLRWSVIIHPKLPWDI